MLIAWVFAQDYTFVITVCIILCVAILDTLNFINFEKKKSIIIITAVWSICVLVPAGIDLYFPAADNYPTETDDDVGYINREGVIVTNPHYSSVGSAIANEPRVG